MDKKIQGYRIFLGVALTLQPSEETSFVRTCRWKIRTKIASVLLLWYVNMEDVMTRKKIHIFDSSKKDKGEKKRVNLH